MKYAICNETFAPPANALFAPWNFPDTCACIARLGYHAVELAPFTFYSDPRAGVRSVSAEQRRKIRKTAEEASLQIVGLHWLLVQTEGLHLTSPDPAVRKATRDYAEALVDFCAEVGGRVLVWGSPKQRIVPNGVSQTQAMEFAAEIFRAVMPRCEKRGVTLCIEPLAHQETNFITTAEEGARLCEIVNHPNCALHLDVKAMSSERRPIPDIIRAHAKRLCHFHANDPNLRGPGQGPVDHAPIAAALRQIGYNGFISVEVFDYTPDPETIARQSIEYMKLVYR